MTGLRVWLHPSSRTKICCWSSATALHSSPFRRTASVVRNRRDVTNRAYFDSRRRQRAHRRLAARSWTADAHIHAAHPVIARHVCGIRRRLLGGKRRALARSAEAERSRTLPRQNVAVHVGDGHDRVIEGRLHVAKSMRNVLALLLFEGFLLALFIRCGCCAARCCWFCHKFALSSWLLALSSKPKAKSQQQDLRFRRRFLLLRHRSLARTLAGTGIRMSALAADRKIAAVAESAIGADFDETLDVHRNFLAQVALYQPLGLNDGTDAVDLFFAQVLHLLHGLDLRLVTNTPGARMSDAVDIRQRDINMLLA